MIAGVMRLANGHASNGESMSISRQFSLAPVVVVLLWAVPADRVSSQLVQSSDQAAGFPHAALACKVRMGPITERDAGTFSGTRCDATCRVISTLKGELEGELQLAFSRHVNGRLMLNDIKAGNVYVVLLNGQTEPYEMLTAMRAVEQVVEPEFGLDPGDRLLAELVAMWKTDDADMHLPAIRQIGIMRDRRGSKVVSEAANSEDTEIARAGLIAQYRMGIAPDANRTMEVFDKRMLNVWYQESGRPQSDSTGKRIMRREGRHTFLERGLPDFDYATYVRQGIRMDWVRENNHTLYEFFGVPWKVQRKVCVPELVNLLEDPDTRVREWAVVCLEHTVENRHTVPRREQGEEQERKELDKWRTWWKEKGNAYMSDSGK